MDAATQALANPQTIGHMMFYWGPLGVIAFVFIVTGLLRDKKQRDDNKEMQQELIDAHKKGAELANKVADVLQESTEASKEVIKVLRDSVHIIAGVKESQTRVMHMIDKMEMRLETGLFTIVTKNANGKKRKE